MDSILIDVNNISHIVSPLLYGIFFEDINYAADGGLYAELIANSSFEFFDTDNGSNMQKKCWNEINNINFSIVCDQGKNNIQKHYAKLIGERGSGIRNTGFGNEGFAVKKNETYRLTCKVRSNCKTKLMIRIMDQDEKNAVTEMLSVEEKEWRSISIELESCYDEEHAFLEILFVEKGEVEIDWISLFPINTYKGRIPGIRNDLAVMLEELSPKFVRFPGGCVVEGRSISNMYNWKDTIGSIEVRKINWNRWKLKEYQINGVTANDYYQSFGLGFFEYFLLCEDIGAIPIPVINVGMTCQWHEGLLVDFPELENWIEDVLDLIEFANGAADSKWGKIRVEMGHKDSFQLEYIGIGNEQWGNDYFYRYEIFEKRILEKYPNIKLIASAGWTSEGDDFWQAYQWIQENSEKISVVDEHYYKDPTWFFDNVKRYDSYDRKMPKVMVGEYAAHTDTIIENRRNNWISALSEGAFMTGLERNSDHVIMACYAPLLAKIGHQQWQPNLIWFSNSKCFGTPNYYVQKLFSELTGDKYIPVTCEDKSLQVSSTLTNDRKYLFVKLINTSKDYKSLELNVTEDIIHGEVYDLFADLDAENSIDDPFHVFPCVSELNMPLAIQQMQPYSIKILKLGLKKDEFKLDK
ncbi:MAG: alpha-L-arabinofuranosidase C-terminal domain-containing protein [Lachnospiraceae bacterium]